MGATQSHIQISASYCRIQLFSRPPPHLSSAANLQTTAGGPPAPTCICWSLCDIDRPSTTPCTPSTLSTGLLFRPRSTFFSALRSAASSRPPVVNHRRVPSSLGHGGRTGRPACRSDARRMLFVFLTKKKKKNPADGYRDNGRGCFFGRMRPDYSGILISIKPKQD